MADFKEAVSIQNGMSDDDDDFTLPVQLIEPADQRTEDESKKVELMIRLFQPRIDDEQNALAHALVAERDNLQDDILRLRSRIQNLRKIMAYEDELQIEARMTPNDEWIGVNNQLESINTMMMTNGLSMEENTQELPEIEAASDDLEVTGPRRRIADFGREQAIVLHLSDYQSSSSSFETNYSSGYYSLSGYDTFSENYE
ncbi:hypothetical protein ACOME3_008708 [Neoechinorhynchus agilis]